MVKVDWIVVQVPSQLLNPPRYWDPRLAFELAHLRQEGVVCFLDWSFFRFPMEVMLKDLRQYESDNPIVLWADYDAYLNARHLTSRLKNYVVRGFPYGKDLPINRDRWIGAKTVTTLPDPSWHQFEREGYWEHSALPFTADTMVWKQRVPLQFRFPRGAVKPREAARMIRKLKVKWWFDSADWLDDLTEDARWTLKLLRILEEMDMDYPYTCRARYDKIDAGLIVKLRESGCRVIDFGEVPVSAFDREADRERLQGAVLECRRRNVFPTLHYAIDEGATMGNCREATAFALAHDLIHKPEVYKDYGAADDEELELMNKDLWNPTDFTELQLLGVISAMEKGRLTPFDF